MPPPPLPQSYSNDPVPPPVVPSSHLIDDWNLPPPPAPAAAQSDPFNNPFAWNNDAFSEEPKPVTSQVRGGVNIKIQPYKLFNKYMFDQHKII